MDYKLDFFVLSGIPRAVIVADGFDELSAIEREMREQYPSLMKLWKNGELGRYTNGTAYVAPHIYDKISPTLQVTSDSEYWEKRGYEFVRFRNLVVNSQDFGEFETSSIDLLGL